MSGSAAAFDIRAFHDAVLANGAVALPTLQAIVEGWTASTAAATASTATDSNPTMA